MKNTATSSFTKLFGALALMGSCLLHAQQVGINTTTPQNGTVLDIHSSDKGFLMPRVALSGTDDTSTISITGLAPTTGLMVYNTYTGGGAGVAVIPGFYYWNGSSWRRFFNQGYELEYVQSAAVTASTTSTTYVILPGLDTGNITVPFTGTYQVRVEAFYSAGNLISTAQDGASQGAISLALSTSGGAFTTIKSTYVTSGSKRIGATSTTVNNLSESATIVWNIELTAGTTYRFAVRGREWLANNCQTGSFGRDTSGYGGAGGVNTAQRGTMSIRLIKQ